jgi:hypothetical protein
VKIVTSGLKARKIRTSKIAHAVTSNRAALIPGVFDSERLEQCSTGMVMLPDRADVIGPTHARETDQ